MNYSQKKNILIGITGGIAAYKSAELVRLLIKQGYCVKVCMTQAATKFITPLTLQALSSHPVHTDLLDTQAEAAMGHIALAKWVQQIIIAPCSADFIARLAQGFANDLLSTVCLASAAPLAIAPAMNQQMWQHLAVQDNIKTLQHRGTNIWGPALGQQACGDIGLGRMLEPNEIIEYLQKQHQSSPLLQGIKVLITAGATREAIDPVRFISNRSSGKMGYAIAQAAQIMGAEVTLISGIVTLDAPYAVQRITVESAQQMYAATMEYAEQADIFIATAAVADYSPTQVSVNKIKKTADQLRIELQKNPDILASVSRQFPRIFTLGFAAETDNLIPYAREKLNNKKLNMIAANWVGANKAFDQDDNALEVLWQGGNHSLENMSKPLLAKALLQLVSQHFTQYRNTL
jgi:phosphopantothenoylcysteine decarboxylase/phosphopantothenate--cysteine ligase